MSCPSRILVVEDDPDLAQALVLELEHAGYAVHAVGDGPAALRLEAEWKPDLVLLDLGLPSLDGLDVCRRLRSATRAPVIVLTARDAVADRVRGLDAGADDYIVKPFSLDELLARVRSALRRASSRDHGGVLRAGDLVLDAAARTVTRRGEPVRLTRREFDLLECLKRHPGQVLDRATLLRRSSRRCAALATRSGRRHERSRDPCPLRAAHRRRCPAGTRGPRGAPVDHQCPPDCAPGELP